jgi:hypothetical protein
MHLSSTSFAERVIGAIRLAPGIYTVFGITIASVDRLPPRPS